MDFLLLFLVWLFLVPFGYLLGFGVFHRLPDRGFGLAPWIAVVSTAFVHWWLQSLFSIPLSGWTTWLILVGLTVISGLWLRKRGFSLLSLCPPLFHCFAHLGVWLVLYWAYSWFTNQNPSILGIEKIPDFSILLSNYQSAQLPPGNLMASELPVNYYYFGFYQVATLAQLSGLSPTEIFNPMKSVILISSFSALMSLSFLVASRIPELQSRKAQLGSALLVPTFAYAIGNFHTLFETYLIRAKAFWYPDATRYIEKTIHEFPLYSFIIGDLHAHLIHLPAAGFTLILIFLFTESLGPKKNQGLGLLKENVHWVLLLGFAFGLSYSSNSWETLGGLLLIGFLTWFGLRDPSLLSLTTLRRTAALSFLYVAASVVAYLPFWLQFEPISNGVGWVPTSHKSPLYQLMVIWVTHGSLPLILLLSERQKNHSYIFLKILAFLGFGLIALMEFFYIKDIYTDHIRANTLFKIGLQVWIWFSIVSGIYLTVLGARASNSRSPQLIAAVVLGVFLLMCGSLYTIHALPQHLKLNQKNSQYSGPLDFLKHDRPAEYEAIQWLKTNASPRQVIATGEAQSFSEESLISVFAGLPTPLTWTHHNWLWHGSFDRPMKPTSSLQLREGVLDSVSQRSVDMENLYESLRPVLAKQLIDKYKIRYVLVSNFERKRYPGLNEGLLRRLGQLVFSRSHVQIYEVSDYELESM